MKNRPLAVLIAGIAVFGAVGCGGGEEMSRVLGYFPEDTGQMFVLSTDLDSEQYEVLNDRVLSLGLPEIESELPPLERYLREALESAAPEADYEEDLEPLLGQPLVLGVTDTQALLRDQGVSDVVMALDTGDGERARGLLAKLNLEARGAYEQATLYGEAGAEEPSVAVDGDVVIALDTARPDDRSQISPLEQAIARASSGDGLSEAQFDEALQGLPDEALLRAYGDLGPILAAPTVAPLRALPWVDAAHNFGAAVSFEPDAVELDGVINTDPSRLRTEDLPLPAGAPTPGVVRREGEIAGASANQSQTTVFLLRAVRAAYPDSRFVRDVAQLEDALEIDFERDVLRQFNGPSTSSVAASGAFAARSEVEDPQALLKLMRRLAPDLGRLVQDLQALRSQGLVALFLVAPDAPIAPQVLGRSRIAVERVPGEQALYEMSNLVPPGRLPSLPTPVPDRIVFGLIDDVFVVASDVDRANWIAHADAEPLDDVDGATVAAGDLQPVEDAIMAFLGVAPWPLGEMTASASATTSELRAHAEIGFASE
jgi:hypothetical protein